MAETRQLYLPSPFTKSSAAFLLFLLAVLGLAFYAWMTQLREGLAVTGLNRPVAWGVYMANFVFYISVSMSGTFISAVIRLLKLDWGKPISRVAEILTVGSLLMAALNILFDVGQLWRALLYIPVYGRIQSPVGWDVIVLLFYLLMSLGYLHLSVIPDAALLSETGSRLSRIYNLLRYDWIGEEKQTHLLEDIGGRNNPRCHNDAHGHRLDFRDNEVCADMERRLDGAILYHWRITHRPLTCHPDRGDNPMEISFRRHNHRPQLHPACKTSRSLLTCIPLLLYG
jgi:hypothetical protein